MKKKLYKGLSYFMAVLVLCISVFAQPIQVQVSGTGTLTLKKLIDMSLTKSGVIANSSTLSKLESSMVNILNGTASYYDSYCDAMGLEKNEESLASWMNSEYYLYPGTWIVKWAMDPFFFLDWFCADSTVRKQLESDDVVNALYGSSVLQTGQLYTIPDEFVDEVYSTFQDYANDEVPYLYVDTFKLEDIAYPLWFADMVQYRAFIGKFKELGDDILFDLRFRSMATNPQGNFSNAYETSYTNILANMGIKYPMSNEYYAYFDGSNIKLCDADGVSIGSHSWCMGNKYSFNSAPNATIQKFIDGSFAVIDGDYYSSGSVYSSSYSDRISVLSNYQYCTWSLVTLDGRSLKVWKDKGSALLYANGWQEYYIDETASAYDSSQDNTITYSGDYIGDTYNQISYDTITNNYDNSEHITNNVVGDTITNITNNYYYTTTTRTGII